VHGQAGEPPYLVRWADSGRETLFVPGPDSRVEHHGPPPPAAQAGLRRVQTWHVDLYVSDGSDGATAHAVLHPPAPGGLEGRGSSRGPESVAEIDDEVAAANALRQLADHLLAAAAADRAALGQRTGDPG